MLHILGSVIKLIWYLVVAVFLAIWLVVRTFLVLIGNLAMATLVGFLYFCWLSVGQDIKPILYKLILIATGDYERPHPVTPEGKRAQLKKRVKTNAPRVAAFNQPQLIKF